MINNLCFMFVLISIVIIHAILCTESLFLIKYLLLILMSKLILHFDLNETIIVGDPTGGDTFEESLNKIICKNALVRCSTGSPHGRWPDFEWHDGSPLDPVLRESNCAPPLLTIWDKPEGVIPFYEVQDLKEKFAKSFTEPESPGHIYRGEYEKLLQALRIQPKLALDKRLSHDGLHHYVIPAFFHTLQQLSEQGRDFVVVLRTFGADGPHVAAAIEAWAQGNHTIPGVPELTPTARFTGAYDANGRFTLTDAVGGSVLGEEESVNLIESGAHRCILIRDHYDWWKDHGYAPSSGKPLWLSAASAAAAARVHHIFFDDNIHNKADDSIIAVRLRLPGGGGGGGGGGGDFAPVSGEATRRLHGMVLVKVPTAEPILRLDWFLQQIAACEAAFDPAAVSRIAAASP